MKKTIELLKELGYNEKNINKIIESNLDSFKDDTLFYQIKKVYILLITLGYSNKEIIQMTKTHPVIYGLSIYNFKQKIEDMIALGYTKEDVIKMAKYAPSIYTLNINNIKNKIEDMMLLGFTEKEVIEICKGYPPIFTHKIETIKNKIVDIISLGYTKEEVFYMIITLPSILGLSIENIGSKVEFYNSIGLREMIIKDPRKLIQSVELSYLRYEYYTKECDMDIDMYNYNILFVNSKYFEKRFGVNKKQLAKKYIKEKKR